MIVPRAALAEVERIAAEAVASSSSATPLRRIDDPRTDRQQGPVSTGCRV